MYIYRLNMEFSPKVFNSSTSLNIMVSYHVQCMGNFYSRLHIDRTYELSYIKRTSKSLTVRASLFLINLVVFDNLRPRKLRRILKKVRHTRVLIRALYILVRCVSSHLRNPWILHRVMI